jgi:hypothetical protein
MKSHYSRKNGLTKYGLLKKTKKGQRLGAAKLIVYLML